MIFYKVIIKLFYESFYYLGKKNRKKDVILCNNRVNWGIREW